MTGPFQAARLRLLKAERERRQAAAKAPVVYRALDQLNSDRQREAHLLRDDRGPARSRAFFAGRRSGKTTLVQHELLEAATLNPGRAVVYLGPTINLAVKTVWAELVQWAAPLGGVPNIANHWITFPEHGGSVIYVMGAETRATVDRIRGIKKICYLAWDEQQNYDTDLALYALGSVIQPALADEQGRLVLMGTGTAPRGHWFDIVEGKNSDFVVMRGWTMWDNPVIKDPDAELGKICRLRGVTPQDPYVRREVGSRERGIEFTTDSERSVMPKIVLRPVQVREGGRYLVGADVGSVDATAAAVYWLHPHVDQMAMVYAEKRKTPGTSDQIAFIRGVAARFQEISTHPVHLAIDPGGGGKAVIEDLARLGGFGEILPAEKINKASNCRLMADDLRTGRLVITPEAKVAADGLEALEWEPGHEGEKLRGHADDAADGAVYGWRLAKKLFEFTPEPPPSEIASDLQEFMAQEEKQLAALSDLGLA